MKNINLIIFCGVQLVIGSCSENNSDIERTNIVWITSEDNEYEG